MTAAVRFQEGRPRWSDEPDATDDGPAVAATILTPDQLRDREHGTPGRWVTVRTPDGGASVVRSAAWCGECDMCTAGFRVHCRSMTTLGEADTPGGLRTHLAVSQERLVPVPPELDAERAAFAEPVAAALHMSRLLTIQNQPFITVLGDTLEAMLAAQVLSRLNASVRLLAEREHTLERAAKWGVRHRPVSEAGRRADQDIVVMASTEATPGMALALTFVRPRGTIVCTGNVGRLELDMRRVVAGELRLLGTEAGDVESGLAAILREEVDVASLITHRCRMDRVEALMQAAADPEAVAIVAQPPSG